MNLPFRVLPVVKELGRTRLEVNVKVKAMFTFKLFATNVLIKIPLPKNTAAAHVSAASGKCKCVGSMLVGLRAARHSAGRLSSRMRARRVRTCPLGDESGGSFDRYEPAQGGIIWKLRRFPGDTEYFMSGEVEMMFTAGT